MNSRRNIIKKILFIISAMPFLSSKASACNDTWSGEYNHVSVSKKYLKKFYIGNVNKFLNNEYNDMWEWTKDIAVTSKTHIERWWAAPITISSSIMSNKDKLYCSKIDIVYSDEFSSGTEALYFIASINLKNNAIPYYSTRIRMSSNKAKIYAALTFRDINTNEKKEVKISSVPVNLKIITCTPYWFHYENA